VVDGWCSRPLFFEIMLIVNVLWRSLSVAVLSLVSSIMTLTFISCDRFFGIVFAMKAHVTERRSCVIIAIIWVAAVGISSPLLIYRQQYERQWMDHLEVMNALVIVIFSSAHGPVVRALDKRRNVWGKCFTLHPLVTQQQ
jgi:hypothetical protein